MDLHNEQAERSILGSILVYPELIDEATELVSADDFFFEQNKTLFRLFVEFVGSGTPIDLVAVVDGLKKKNVFADVGSEAYLAELMSGVVSSSHISVYCNLVANCAIRRKLLLTSTEIRELAENADLSAKQAVSKAEELVYNVTDRTSRTVSDLGSVLSENLSQLEAARSAQGTGGITTGFGEVDDYLGSLRGGELIIVAARPGMGKTAFAANIALYSALCENKKTLFVSLEMTRSELANRLICSHAFLSLEQLRDCPTESTLKKYKESAEILQDIPLLIDDTPSRTVVEITSVCRREKRRYGLDLLVVDYLGLIEPDDPKQPRQEQVASFTRRLKLLAKDLNIPVICCAQLNRNLELTKDNRPRLSHLRESGAIEQDADVVILLHREEYYMTKEIAEEKGLTGRAEIIIAKHRNGRTGTAHLKWSGETCQFLNFDELAPSDEYDEFASFDETTYI